MPDLRTLWSDALLTTPNDAERGSLDGYARAVAFVLVKHMNSSGGARPGTRTLAREAGVSHSVAEARVRALEAAGWLSVTRRFGAGNQYRATIPTALQDSAVEGATAPPFSAVDRATSQRGRRGDPPVTAPSQAKTAPPGSHEPENQQPPTASSAVTHEDPEPAEEPKGKITPKRILTEMARRKLGVAREQRAEWAPPEGCDPRRENAWLTKEVDALRAQHGFTLDAMIARLHPENPAKPKHADPDYYVWRIDPALARRDWGIRNAAETRADLERDRAAAAARMATPEQRERNRQGREAALALQARLRAQRQTVPA